MPLSIHTTDQNTKSVPRCLTDQLSSLINSSTASAEVNLESILGLFLGCALSEEFCPAGKRRVEELELAAVVDTVASEGCATDAALSAVVGISGDSNRLVLKGG